MILGAITLLGSGAKFACPGIAEYFKRESHTTISFVSANDAGITITATNSGQKPSVIESAQLRFDGKAPVDPAGLDLHAETNVVPAGGSVSLKLNPRSFQFDSSVTEGNLREWLNTSSLHATIDCKVVESNGPAHREAQIDASRLDQFLGKYCCSGGQP